jgi:transcription-repair coupling factor (superfamily II helicase)
MSLTEEAEKRLEVIREFSHLGSGFQIALKDLEIRGAGNILGAEQSGCIAAVGFDLYCQILKEAVEEKRGIRRERKIDPPIIELPVDAFIPEDYISDSRVKLEMYRKIAEIEKIEDIQGVIDEFKDRFGNLPENLLNLFEVLKIKLLSWDLGAPYIKDIQGKVQILIPGEQNFPLRRVQNIFEQTGVTSYFYKSILALENLYGQTKKSLIPKSEEKDPPSVWLPKLQKILQMLIKWTKKKNKPGV